ncbi:odorant receptor Or1-like [Bombyx mandarina]|uniref:Odorant receptor n=1 Tax=Bombyx mandarina TaxID=7092 RepID=A0A6J2JUW2_BOMMA|nr:odorant receptor Or1-like [Bombyx mandarina]
MKLWIRNANFTISLSLTLLRCLGFWSPDGLAGNKRLLYNCYSFVSFMFLLGIYILIQVVDMIKIWGDLPLMTGTAFLLFTNFAHATKVINIVIRKNRIQRVIQQANAVLMGVQSEEARRIVKSCNVETSIQLCLYFLLTFVTTVGWATSAEKHQLPLRAWYPYDTSKSPAYELTYVHQVAALLIAAYINVAKDSLVSSLIAQCRCRLRLVGLALASLGQDLKIDYQSQLSPAQENILNLRLKACVLEHQTVLAAVTELQACFSKPTFAQFTVSLIIICVTAFQLVSQTGNLVRLLSMGTYLMNMIFQVFIYCYQGNKLSVESSEIAGSAYISPWYLGSVKFRRALLIVMVRSRRVAKITAGGFTTLSLASFMAIIKASYSLFTLLQQVEQKK